MTPKELMTNVVLAVIGIAVLLFLVGLVIFCYRYLYRRLPKPLKSLV